MKDKSLIENYQITPELLHELVSEQQSKKYEEIDFFELCHATWKGKWLIIGITTAFVMLSTLYAISLPNLYKAEALLAPATEEQGGMNGLASKLGGLASLAGVNLGGGGSVDNTALGLQIMKSRVFINKFIEQNKLLIPLMATEGWDRDSNEFIYDSEIYDIDNHKWVRKIKAPFKSKPSPQESYKYFNKIVKVRQDKASTMITVSVTQYSPLVAKEWVDLLVKAINTEMKERDLIEARRSVAYLEKQLALTKVSEVRNVLYQLIEEQAKTIMFANVRDEYVFKTIDPALIPELKAEPKRGMICLLGLFLGVAIGTSINLAKYFKVRSLKRSDV